MITDFDVLFSYLNKKFLYHALWQVSPQALSTEPVLVAELEKKLEQMKDWTRQIICPVHKNICVEAEFKEDKIYIKKEGEILFVITHKIPQKSKEITFQIVSLGHEAVDKAIELKENHEYMDYFYWHGFCGALTEALAEMVHTQIIPCAKRYSFGYEALPEIMEQNNVLKLLNAEEIGVKMTESGMIEPEYSTCAVIIKNP